MTRASARPTRTGIAATIDERREVDPADAAASTPATGWEPAELDADTLVSMNLWGFAPGMRDGPSEAAMAAAADADEAEVLLPEMVERDRRGRGRGRRQRRAAFAVLPTDGRCVGVTHPDDLGARPGGLARQVADGRAAGVALGAPLSALDRPGAAR